MGDEKKGDLAVGNQKPITVPYNEFEATYKTLKIWVAKHSLPVKTALTTVKTVARGVASIDQATIDGAALGFLAEIYYKDACSSFKIHPPSLQIISQSGRYKPLVQSFLGGEILEPARNFAIMAGVDATISFVMKELRGKEDVQTNLVAGFGYGVVLSLVTGVRGPSVLSVVIISALMNVGIYKMNELCEKPSR